MQTIKDAFFKFCSGVSMALTRNWEKMAGT